MVDVNGDANAVHLLTTCALTDERLFVLAHVRPVVTQADQLGHCAVGSAMPHCGLGWQKKEGKKEGKSWLGLRVEEIVRSILQRRAN